MDLIFWKLKKAKKTWISFFENLAKLKNHEFNFLQDWKAQKLRIEFFASFKSSKNKIHSLNALIFRRVSSIKDLLTNKKLARFSLLCVGIQFGQYHWKKRTIFYLSLTWFELIALILTSTKKKQNHSCGDMWAILFSHKWALIVINVH